jgi:hypothetical protein
VINLNEKVDYRSSLYIYQYHFFNRYGFWLAVSLLAGGKLRVSPPALLYRHPGDSVG